MLRDLGVFVASALVLGILALGGWRVSTMEERDLAGRRSDWLMEDITRMRCLVGMAVASPELPMADGAFDPYHFVRSEDIVDVRLLRSERLGKGPTEEEARRGDYANFPWERYRGERKALLPAFPLLWEPAPTTKYRLVGFSDGSVIGLESDDLERLGLGR